MGAPEPDFGLTIVTEEQAVRGVPKPVVLNPGCTLELSGRGIKKSHHPG